MEQAPHGYARLGLVRACCHDRTAIRSIGCGAPVALHIDGHPLGFQMVREAWACKGLAAHAEGCMICRSGVPLGRNDQVAHGTPHAVKTSKGVDGRRVAQVEMVFHNVTYLLTVSAGADDTLCVEVEQKDDGSRWRGDFTMRYVEDITAKTGNYKKYAVFVKMLLTAITEESDSVFVDLLTYSVRPSPVDTLRCLAATAGAEAAAEELWWQRLERDAELLQLQPHLEAAAEC